MISLELTGNERLQFQYILPIQGCLSTLELVEKILFKAKIDDNNLKNLKKIEFEDNEIDFIKEMISILDNQNQLKYESLSLIRKILNIKENKKI